MVFWVCQVAKRVAWGVRRFRQVEQVPYKRYFQGDWLRNAALRLSIYDWEPLMERAREFLERY